jgi:hypothetical protein
MTSGFNYYWFIGHLVTGIERFHFVTGFYLDVQKEHITSWT